MVSIFIKWLAKNDIIKKKSNLYRRLWFPCKKKLNSKILITLLLRSPITSFVDLSIFPQESCDPRWPAFVSTGSPSKQRPLAAFGFSISHNVWAWSIGVLEKRARDKIAVANTREFTFGISLPYIWASTGNATILSVAAGSWRSVREMLPWLVFY